MDNKVESRPKLETDISGNNGRSYGGFPSAQGDSLIEILGDPNFPLVLSPNGRRDKSNNPVAFESFSILRSRLLSAHNKLGIKSVVITSAQAGDGKTLIATNLALSLGQLGSKRLLLLDGDLRAGHATRILRLGHLPGIGDFLQGNKPFEAVVHTAGFPSLSIAPTGVVPKHALPQILEGPRWAEFLEQAKQRFDLIVVDCLPASAPVADLELLTAPCDAILIVVYMRQTHRAALKRATARLDPKKFLGAIINNSDEIYDYDYGYYDLRSQVPQEAPTRKRPQPASSGETARRSDPHPAKHRWFK